MWAAWNRIHAHDMSNTHNNPQCEWCNERLVCYRWRMEMQDANNLWAQRRKRSWATSGEEKRGGGHPLLVKREMTTGWRPDGRGSGQHAGVLWIHVLHVHDICTYSALVYRVIESRLFRHVVIWWRGCRHSDGLPLQSGYRQEKVVNHHRITNETGQTTADFRTHFET